MDLAQRLGYSLEGISFLINGQALITEEVALNLEKILGGSASFWLFREAQYRAIVKLAAHELIEDEVD